jgi:hypothetical protein
VGSDLRLVVRRKKWREEGAVGASLESAWREHEVGQKWFVDSMKGL